MRRCEKSADNSKCAKLQKVLSNCLFWGLALDSMDAVSTTEPADAAQEPEIADSAPVSSGVQPLRVPMDPAERLLQLVTERGGEVFGGHRSFARAIGISHGHVSAVLGDLSAAGKIAVEATKRGTRVRLLRAA